MSNSKGLQPTHELYPLSNQQTEYGNHAKPFSSGDQTPNE